MITTLRVDRRTTPGRTTTTRAYAWSSTVMTVDVALVPDDPRTSSSTTHVPGPAAVTRSPGTTHPLADPPTRDALITTAPSGPEGSPGPSTHPSGLTRALADAEGRLDLGGRGVAGVARGVEGDDAGAHAGEAVDARAVDRAPRRGGIEADGHGVAPGIGLAADRGVARGRRGDGDRVLVLGQRGDAMSSGPTPTPIVAEGLTGVERGGTAGEDAASTETLFRL